MKGATLLVFVLQSRWDWLFRAGCPLRYTQDGWESRQSVRGHMRSRKQACLPQLSLHEWWLLWNVSLLLFPFLPVRISERCGTPPLSFSVRQCRYADMDGHVQRGWLLCLENTDSTPGWKSTMQQKMKIMLFARQEIRPVTDNLSACWDCRTGWGQFFFLLSWKHFNVAALPSPSSPWVWRSVSHYWLPTSLRPFHLHLTISYFRLVAW